MSFHLRGSPKEPFIEVFFNITLNVQEAKAMQKKKSGFTLYSNSIKLMCLIFCLFLQFVEDTSQARVGLSVTLTTQTASGTAVGSAALGLFKLIPTR